MPNVRPINKKYGISKHAFATAYSYCLQYSEWKAEIENIRLYFLCGEKCSTLKKLG